MSHVLTVKIPLPLLHDLQEVSGRRGQSKGAVVREAIESFLKTGKAVGAEEGEAIRKATEAMRLGKRIRCRVDWSKIRRLASAPQAVAPEEEIRISRRRGM